MTGGPGSTNKAAQFLHNPFAVKSPEELTKEQIVNLFVSKYTKIELVKERKHTFVWGSRGSGKSMMLRYLEPQCKAIVHDGLEKFLAQDTAFVGVYCPCKEGHLNKAELGLLDDLPRLVVTEHLLNLTVAERVIACLTEQFPPESFSVGSSQQFTTKAIALFDKASISSSIAEADQTASREKEPLKWLGALLTAELYKISRFLRALVLSGGAARYEGAATGYHDFLLPFIRLARVLLGKPAPLYVLLDDADRLTLPQQQIVNTWMANRDQRDVCLKVSARREGYRIFSTRDGVEIEEPHDYSTVDVDELYTESKSDYAQKVILIANRRLALSSVPTKEIRAFLPPDPVQEELLTQLKQDTASEWKAAGCPGRQADYVFRYAIARLFQRLRDTKRRRNYAGFENVVHLSSGIVRDFLEPCYLMFAKLLNEGKEPNQVTEIPPPIQDQILFDYSEEYVIHKFVAIRQGMPPEKWGVLKALETLINSLGKLFYERLHDPQAREARLFSFTIRSSIPADIEEVLQLGIFHRYFQLRSYSTKEGGGREKWYILNRRVCPVFKLDPTGFEGRISLTAAHLKLACDNPERFVQLRLKQVSSEESPSLFSLEE
jgi:hypothetical protein